MKYLFFILLSGCTLTAQHKNVEQKKDIEFNKLIINATNNNIKFKEVNKKVKAKEDKMIAQTINKITTLKAEVSDLKMEISDMKIKTDTIYIHDTIVIKEKKNFWGKTKIDTTNNN
jgi:hypothetical protein